MFFLSVKLLLVAVFAGFVPETLIFQWFMNYPHGCPRGKAPPRTNPHCPASQLAETEQMECYV
jgi:hypothetical protein